MAFYQKPLSCVLSRISTSKDVQAEALVLEGRNKDPDAKLVGPSPVPIARELSLIMHLAFEY